MTDRRHLDQAIAESLDALGAFGATYPIHVEQPEGLETVPADQALAPGAATGYFRRSIRAWTDHPEAENPRAAASRFMRRYLGSIASAALVPLANGVAFDVSLPRISLVMRDDMPMGVVVDLDGAPIFTSAERPSAWPVRGRELPTDGALRDQVIRNLVVDHLQPAFRRVSQESRLSVRTMWTTAAEQIDVYFQHAMKRSGDAGRRALLAEDRRAVLDAPSLPGVEGANPMLGVLSWEPHEAWPEPVQVRRFCCTCYLVPGRGTHCGSCPLLTPDERIAVMRAGTRRLQVRD